MDIRLQADDGEAYDLAGVVVVPHDHAVADVEAHCRTWCGPDVLMYSTSVGRMGCLLSAPGRHERVDRLGEPDAVGDPGDNSLRSDQDVSLLPSDILD